MRNRFISIANGIVIGTALFGAGCDWFGTEQPKRKILVPDELAKQSDYTPEGQYPRSRYVLRMTDGERDWEVEFPEVATGYEIRIPLQGEPDILRSKAQGTPLTAADREILADMQRQNPELARRLPAEPAPDATASAASGALAADGTTSALATGAGDTSAAVDPSSPAGTGAPAFVPEPPRTSYLEGLAEIRELYRTKNYEVALVRLVALERQYPHDERLLSMKGSLYRQLGRTELARQAWEEVLKINPDNHAVIDALGRMTR